jgi:hypothetical protein
LISINGLGRSLFRGDKRLPSPAAMITQCLNMNDSLI